MIKVAKDLPEELVSIAARIKPYGMGKAEIDKKVGDLKQVAVKYGIPKRRGKASSMKIEGDAKLQPFGTLVSQMDFSKYNSFVRKTAMAFIENYLKKQGFLR